MCLDCLADDVDCWGTVDLCTDVDCLKSTFKLPRFRENAHTPKHDITRFRVLMCPTRDMPELHRRAKHALDLCRTELYSHDTENGEAEEPIADASNEPLDTQATNQPDGIAQVGTR